MKIIHFFPPKKDKNKLFDIDQKKLFEYINQYDKMSLYQIAEHFFPAPLSYSTYLGSPSRFSAGFVPGKFAKTAQIVETALETIKHALINAIENQMVSGFIKTTPRGLYYINLEELEKILEELKNIEKQIDELGNNPDMIIQLEEELVIIKKKANSMAITTEKSEVLRTTNEIIKKLKGKEILVKRKLLEKKLKDIKGLIKISNYLEAKNQIENIIDQINQALPLFEADFSDLKNAIGELSIELENNEKEYYNGIKIEMGELNALKDFEKILGKSIPLIRKEEIKDPWEKFYQESGSPGASIKFGAMVEGGTITHLNLKESGLKSIPNSIDRIKSLKSLDLSFNFIKELPKEIGNLNELERLYIENTGTKHIPILARTPFSKQAFKEKKCEHCLEFIPDSFCNLVSLKKLNLSGNNLETLPNLFGMIKNLESLRLDHNLIYELPDSIGDLNKLKILDLSGNKLSSLSSSIGNLENLEEIILNYNQIKELPDSIGDLNKLKELDLRDNKLNSLPSSFGKLKLLDFLDLGKNEFVS